MPQIAIAFAVSAATTALSFAFQSIFAKTQEGPRTEEFRATSSRYSAPIPITYGSVRLGSNIIDAGVVLEVRIRGGKRKPTIYEYYQTIAAGICEGPITKIIKIWADKELIYNATAIGSTGITPQPLDPAMAAAMSATPLPGGSTLVSAQSRPIQKFAFAINEYHGDEVQTADPYLVAIHGAGNVPGHRGLAYVVFPDFPLHETANRIPILEFEIAGLSTNQYSWLVSEPLGFSDLAPAVNFGSGLFTPLYPATYTFVQSLWADPNRPYIYAVVLAYETKQTSPFNTIARNAAFAKISKLTGDTILLEPARYDLSGTIYGSNLGERDTAPYAIVAAGSADRIFTLKTFDIFFEGISSNNSHTWFVELSPLTLTPIAVSTEAPNLGVLYSIGNNDIPSKPLLLISNGNGRYVFAVFDGNTPFSFKLQNSWGLWDTAINSVSWGYMQDLSAVFATASFENPVAQSFCFDASDNLWCGTLSGYLYRFSITNGIITYVSRFLPIDPVIVPPTNNSSGFPYSIRAITYVPSTNELLLWYVREFDSHGPVDPLYPFGLMVRFSIDSLSVTSSQFAWEPGFSLLTYTEQPGYSFGAAQEEFSDKAGVWTDDPTFASGGYDYNNIYTFNLVDAETGVQTAYPITLWYGVGNEFGYYGNENQNNVIYNKTMNAFMAIRNDNFGDWIQEPLKQGFGIYFLNRYTPSATTLKTICDDLCSKAKMLAADYDYTAFAGTAVRGFIIDRRMNVRQALQSIQPAFLFSIVESDWKLKGFFYGNAPVLTIDEDLLGAKQTISDREDKLTIKRINDAEIPEWLDVNYFDADRDYLTGSEHARRSDGTQSSDNIATIDIPAVFTNDEAATIALKLLYFMWARQEEFKFRTWLNALKLDPGDSILVNRGLRQYEIRTKRISMGANGVIEIEAESFDTGVFSLTATSTGVSGFTPAVVPVYSTPKLFVLDTALLRSSDDAPGVYVAAGPEIAGLLWGGADVEKGPDVNSFVYETSVPQGLTFGYAQSILPDTDEWTTWDRTNTLSVFITDGSLVSQSEAQLLTSPTMNLAIVGDELIQFAVATQITANEWVLSTLLRGRFGTEQHRATHIGGDRFVVLNSNVVGKVDYPASEIDQSHYYRAVSQGISPYSAPDLVVQLTRRLWPYAPYYIQATRPGSVVITWLRRSRVPGYMLNDSPLFETTEEYEVDILPYSGSIALRTITATPSAGGSYVDAANQTCYYTAADELADFGSNSAAGGLRVVVYQLNSIVGRGYPGEGTV